MAHQQQDVSVHHEGDAHEIEVVVENEDGIIIDLTGGSATWLLFEDERDAVVDSNAVLTKAGTDDGDNDEESEIHFETPEDGLLVVNIETDDTDGLVNWSDLENSEAAEFHHRLRVTMDGERATVLSGSFYIYR